MRSNLNLLTTAAVLAFGLSATAALAGDPKGDAPGAKSDITIVTNDTGNASGGTGVEESSESQGATNKQMNEGASSGNASGGTGVEKSADGQGAKNKTMN